MRESRVEGVVHLGEGLLRPLDLEQSQGLQGKDGVTSEGKHLVVNVGVGDA